MIENLANATPFEIDSELARLDGEHDQLMSIWSATIERVHYQLGERKVGQGRSRVWPTSWQTAVTLLQAKVVSNSTRSSYYEPGRAAEILGRLPDLNAKMDANRAEAAAYDAEYDRRPWTRFFLVISSNGHIHSNTRCSSFPRTQHGWQPELSGKTEAEAVAKLGPRMCSKCFPSAPVEWTKGIEKPVDPTACSGHGKNATSIKWYVSPVGTCPDCSGTVSVTSTGRVRKHKPKSK
jgi:hypothetical protein